MRRRDSIVGVNQYANPLEKPLKSPAVDNSAFYKRRSYQVSTPQMLLEDVDNQVVLDRLAAVIGPNGKWDFDACVDAVSAGATLGELTRAIRYTDAPCESITPVCLNRAAAPLEELRNRMNQLAEPAKVFLCNMGPLKDHKARAEFSAGFFAVGGYEAISPPGFKTTQAAIDAFIKSEAPIAVICSTDDNYPEMVPAICAGIRAQKAGALIVLAGFPQDQLEAHKKSGVDEFIHLRADANEVLSNIHKRLRIAS
jgi:methylmalonyl-CoA mutase